MSVVIDNNIGTIILFIALCGICIFLLSKIGFFMFIQYTKKNWEHVKEQVPFLYFGNYVEKDYLSNYIQNISLDNATNIFDNFKDQLEKHEVVGNLLGEALDTANDEITKQEEGTKSIKQGFIEIFKIILMHFQVSFSMMREFISRVYASFISVVYALIYMENIFIYALKFFRNLLYILIGVIIAIMIYMIMKIPSLLFGLITLPLGIAYIVVLVLIIRYLVIFVKLSGHAAKVTSDVIRYTACFDKNTPITLHDNTVKSIKDVIPGDILCDDARVTTVIKIMPNNDKMVHYNGIKVTREHRIEKHNISFEVDRLPSAVPCKNRNKEMLYCINTDTKRIRIQNETFLDWDDVSTFEINCLMRPSIFTPFIHYHYEGGFHKNTKIMMENNVLKRICDIQPGEKTKYSGTVYATMIIYGITFDLYTCNQGIVRNKNVICSISENVECIRKRESYLYHLKTTSGKIHIKNKTFMDYDYAIEASLSIK